MDRFEILDLAKKAVSRRGQRYTLPENNFKRIADLWSVYKGVKFSSKDVAMMMGLLKIGRIVSGHDSIDSYVDLAGYAACAGELDQEE